MRVQPLGIDNNCELSLTSFLFLCTGLLVLHFRFCFPHQIWLVGVIGQRSPMQSVTLGRGTFTHCLMIWFCTGSSHFLMTTIGVSEWMPTLLHSITSLTMEVYLCGCCSVSHEFGIFLFQPRTSIYSLLMSWAQGLVVGFQKWW